MKMKVYADEIATVSIRHEVIVEVPDELSVGEARAFAAGAASAAVVAGEPGGAVLDVQRSEFQDYLDCVDVDVVDMSEIG